MSTSDAKTDAPGRRARAKRGARIWPCTSVLVLFHLLVVVGPLAWVRGSGEGLVYLVLILDAPLYLLLNNVPGGEFILYDSFALFFSVAGTLMYGGVGLAMDLLIRKIFRIPDLEK